MINVQGVTRMMKFGHWSFIGHLYLEAWNFIKKNPQHERAGDP